MPADVLIPEDYRDLIDAYGPGTLCGVLRLLAPDGPPGFDLGAGQSLLTLGIERGYWSADDWIDEYAGEFEGDAVINGVRLDAAVIQAALQEAAVIKSALLWGVFTTGETCWWLPIRDDPADWLILIAGNGWQQLNISTTDFLLRWTGGRLDLPVLPQGAVRREWQITPADQPVTVPARPDAPRDPLSQLATIVGPGNAVPAIYDWPSIEANLGRPLPPDYKRLNETYGDGSARTEISLAFNGIYTNSPLSLHDGEDIAVRDMFNVFDRPPGSPSPSELLFCGSTESRELLAWDTRNPDPSRWPVIATESTIHPGTLADLYVAELTGRGPGLASWKPGDPNGWAWPIWGPDAEA